MLVHRGRATSNNGRTKEYPKLLDAKELALDMSLARVLRGEELTPADEINSNLDVVIRRVEFHGIAGLLGHSALDRLPRPFKDEIRRIAISQDFWEAQHVKLLSPLLEALERAGAGPLIFKGTALAYTHYEKPSSRRRGDTDILVRQCAFEESCHIVRSFGFASRSSGLSVRALGARSFSLEDAHGFTHEIDLHQRINSSSVIAKLFPYEELERRSGTLPKLSSNARAIGPRDALLVACFHRLIHGQVPYYFEGKTYLSSDRLVWLYDIKLLHNDLIVSGTEGLLELAELKGLSAVLADGLDAADQWLMLGNDGLIRHFTSPTEQASPYRYLQSGILKRQMLDFAATQRKGRAIIDLLVPNRDYMQGKYGAHQLTLPLFYLWRVLHGLYLAVRSWLRT